MTNTTRAIIAVLATLIATGCLGDGNDPCDGVADCTASTDYVEISDAVVLDDLSTSAGELTPAFDPQITRYELTLHPAIDAITLSAVAANPGAMVNVGERALARAEASAEIPLGVGLNVITVTSSAGEASVTYEIAVERPPVPSTRL
jgi:hypothetical protein